MPIDVVLREVIPMPDMKLKSAWRFIESCLMSQVGHQPP